MKKSAKDQSNPDFQTPMMQQYMELKQQYPDCLLFFRLGDFYELFMEDAQIGSHILGITLTRRSRGKDGAIPMCGVPYHAIELYTPRLVAAGYKIAIAEQITDPKDTPNLVVRKVVRVLTAGTLLEGRSVNERESSFVCSAKIVKKRTALGFADLATGQFLVTTCSLDQLNDVLHQYLPKEIILSPHDYNSPDLLGYFTRIKNTNISAFLEWESWEQKAAAALSEHFHVSTLASFGLQSEEEKIVASTLLGYLTYTQQGNVSHIQSLTRIQNDEFLTLDATTVESLELFESTMDKTSEGSLFHVIDHTQTAMGARMLKKWLMHPLSQSEVIQKRLDDVQQVIEHGQERQAIYGYLENIIDIERLIAKLSVGIGNARDLNALKNSLELCEKIFSVPLQLQLVKFSSFSGKAKSICDLINQYILDDPKGITKEGGMIKPESDERLKKFLDLYASTTSWLSEFEQQERTRTGIPTLKVGENSVFGFYIEISKVHAQMVQETYGYERKQTLVNAERYITAELKEKERIALSAREKIQQLEFEIFERVVRDITQHATLIQKVAQAIATTDTIVSLAHIALEKNYVKPTLTKDKVLSIKNGRHPVVEDFLKNDFVPNSTDLTQQHRFLLLTGPNMAGKSTYIRQVALIVILAHIGSFVPADHAVIPILNRVFSRIGASDALHKGLSTFMVEMTETARIIRNVTDRSLVIFDEIGRGTGTTDGMSIAQAIGEYMATTPTHPFVFFATHYHELSHIAHQYSSVINASMAVKIHKGQVIFLRTLQEGSTNDSYGVEVASQAGIPASVISRAEVLRRELEWKNKHPATPSSENAITNEIVDTLISLNLEELSPKKAWEILNDLQVKLQKN